MTDNVPMTDSVPTTNDVHSHSMTIKRSVEEVYQLAERDGFALLDIAIDEDRLKRYLG